MISRRIPHTRFSWFCILVVSTLCRILPGQTPTPTPIPSPPENTDTPTPVPTVVVISNEYLEAKWLSIGAPGPLSPHTELVAPGDRLTFGVPVRSDSEPRYDHRENIPPSYVPPTPDVTWTPSPTPICSTTPLIPTSTSAITPTPMQVGHDIVGDAYVPVHPNEYSPLIVQGLYGDSFSAAPTPTFQNPTVPFYCGSVISSIFGIESTDTPTKKEPLSATEVIGSYEIGLITRGGTDYDNFPTVGGTAFAMTAFVHRDETPPSWDKRPWFAQAVIGEVAEAYIGPPLKLLAADPTPTPEPTPTSATPTPAASRIDARLRDVAAAPGGAHVRFMKGFSGTAHLDNAQSAVQWPTGEPTATPTSPPDIFFTNAWGERNLVIVFDPATGMQAGTVRTGYYHLNLGEPQSPLTEPIAIQPTPTGNQATRSVERWTGIEIAPPQARSEAHIVSSQGMNLVGGSAANDGKRYPLDDHIRQSVIQSYHDPAAFASLEARGDAVLGDGVSDIERTGYDTDVTHVRGRLRLDPVAELPDLSGLTPDRQVGVLCFYAPKKDPNSSEIESPSLQISVAADPSQTGGSAYRWVKLQTESLVSAVVSKAASGGAGMARKRQTMQDASPREVQEAIVLEKAADGSASYFAPSLGARFIDNGTVELSFSGFLGRTPAISWRRVELPDGGFPGPSQSGSPSALALTETSPGIVEASAAFPVGQWVEFAAVEARSQRRARTFLQVPVQ